MSVSCKYQNVPDDILIKTGIVLLTGGKDELGCHLIIFQSHQQSTFIQLGYTTLVQSVYNIITYYDYPVISVLVNLNHASPVFLEHIIEVIHQVQIKLLKCEIKRLYIVESNQKSLSKAVRSKQVKQKLHVQVLRVKNFNELHQYIKVKNLTPDFGGVLVHDNKAWINVQKPLNEYYLLVDRVAQATPDIVEKIRNLTSGDGGLRSAKDMSGHAPSELLQKAENKKDALLRQYALTKTLEEGQRLRSYFKNPSLDKDFHALSKTPLLELDKVKFQEFYRKALSIRKRVEKCWQDVVKRLQLWSREQSLHEHLSECSTWIVNYGLPYLKRVPAQTTTLNEAVKQMTKFENEFYKQAKDVLKKAWITVKEVHNCQRTFESSSSCLQPLADNLNSLRDSLKKKLEERRDQYKKQTAFMEVLRKAQTWYEKAAEFWPSRLGPCSHRANMYLSPSNMADVSQSEYDLELFLERYPPLTTKELQTLMEDVDNIADMELRNRARLLGNRCQEMEKIMRARETHLIDTENEEWITGVNMSRECIDTGRLTDSSELYGSHEPLYQRQVSGVGKHSLLSSSNPRSNFSSTRFPSHPTHPSKRTSQRRNPEGNRVDSTTFLNTKTSFLTSEMTTSFSRCTKPGLAANSSNQAKYVRASESRLLNLQRRLRNQELLYEQLVIEEELREIDEARDETPSESFAVQRSELNDSFNGRINREGQNDLTKSRDCGWSNLAIHPNGDIADGKVKPTFTLDPFDESGKQIVGSASVSCCHGRQKEIAEPTSLPGRQLVHETIDIGQQQSVSDNKSSFNSKLLDEIQEKLRIARESEKHWTQVKNEQRVRLGHVICDVSLRKEVEEVYFNAQLKLCQVRRDIAKLNKSRSSLLGLPVNDSNIVRMETITAGHNSNLPGRFGAFCPYVKGDVSARSDGNMVDSCSLGYSESEKESEQYYRMVEEKDSKNISDISGHVDGFQLPIACGGHGKLPLQSSSSAPLAQTPQSTRVGLESEDETAEDSEEFEDEEEEELMILKSDSSSGRHSQEELRDSLREQQEKLEEMFRQQKERFRKEQQELKQEEARIKEWEMKKQFEKLGQEVEERETTYSPKYLGLEEEKLKQVENRKAKEQQKHQEHEEQREVLREYQAQNQRRQVEEYPLQAKQLAGKEKETAKSPKDHVLVEVNEQPSEVWNDKQTSPLLRINQSIDHFTFNSTNCPENNGYSSRSFTRNGASELNFRKNSGDGIGEKVHGENFYSKNAVTPNLGSVDTQIVDPTFTVRGDVNVELGQGLDVRNSTSGNDVNELGQIFVNKCDTDDETMEEIETELIGILREERSTDKEELTEEGTEVKAEMKEQKQMEMKLKLPKIGKNPNFGDVLALKVIEENSDVELMNQVIDDLMIIDQDTVSQKGDMSVNVNNFTVKTFEPDPLDFSARENMDINLEVGEDSRQLPGIRGNDQQTKSKGIVEEDEVDIRTSATEESTKGKHLKRGSHYVGSSDELIEKIGHNNQKVHMTVNEDNGNCVNDVSDVRAEFGRREHSKVNEIIEETEGNYRSNFYSLFNTETGGKEDNTSPVSGTTGDHRRLREEEEEEEEEEGLSIDVGLNIDLAGDVKTSRDDDLSLMNLLRGRELPTVSEVSRGYFQEVEEVAERPEEDQDTDGKLVFSRSLGGVLDGPVRDMQGSGRILRDNGNRGNNISDIRGEYGVKSFTVLKEISEDTKCLQGTFEDDESISNSSLNLDKTNNLKDAIVNAGIVEENGLVHSISGDYKDEEHEEHSGSCSDTGDESEDDFRTVLEDIEEEGSEYEEAVDERGTHIEENVDGYNVKDDAITLDSSTSALPPVRFTDDEKIGEHQVTNTSFSSSIIIDPGSAYCKAGFSVDNKPRVVLPSVVGKPRPQEVTTGRYKDHYVGYEAGRLRRVLTLHHPVERGTVSDWDLMEKMLEYVYDELRCDSDQYPVLLSEPPLNPKVNRERMIQMMFETFHVPAAYICVQAVLALFATGKTTGLVYDCGHGVSHCVPIYEGYALPHATKKIDLAGQDLTACLGRMLRDGGTSLQTSAELEIVQEMKEKLCYIVVDYNSERKAYNTGERLDATYKMPDGQTVVTGSERFRCPEVLFDPSIIGLATDGIHEVIYKTVLQCSIDIRSTMLKNIVLSGGTTMLPGLPRRLHVELSQLFSNIRSPDSIEIEAPEERNVLAWQGGSMLSKLSNFSSMWITEEEYEEFGPAIVHKKCV